MINCRMATELHTSAAEGALTGPKKALYALHMKICGPCKRYRFQLQATVATLAELPDEPPPPDGLLDLLAAELPSKS